MIALALNRLPARTIWKLSQREVAAAGGLEALNLSEKVMVRSAMTPYLLTDTLSDPVSTDAGRSFVQHLAKNIRLNSWDWEDGV